MKKRNKTVAVMLMGMLILLSACGTEEYKLQKKYAAVFDDAIYYEFAEDVTYVRTSPSYNEDDEAYSYTGTYYVDEDNCLTMFDAEEDESGIVQEFSGDIYENYLCSVWQGELPKKHEETEISHIEYTANTYGFEMECLFHEDGAFEFLMYQKDYRDESRELIFSKEGAYEVEHGKVVCTNDDGSQGISAITYFTANDKIYGIWLVAE